MSKAVVHIMVTANIIPINHMHTINIRGEPDDIATDTILSDIIRWFERFIECKVVNLSGKYEVTDDNKSLFGGLLHLKSLPAWKSKFNYMSCVNSCVRLPYIGSFTANLGPPG